MKKTFPFAIALALAASLALPTPSKAASAPNAQETSKFAYLIGTWDCTWKAGPDSGQITSTFSSVLNGSWLQETETVRSASGEPVVTTMHFTGYDPKTKRMMHLGPDADGTYEVAQSPNGGDTWLNLLPDGTGAVSFKKISSSEFSLSENYTQAGQTMSYLETCKKTD